MNYDENRDRVKIISIDQNLMVDMFNWWRSPPGTLLRIDMPGLPEDCFVVSVHVSHERRCIDAVVWSSEFPIHNRAFCLEILPGLATEFEAVSFEDIARSRVLHHAQFDIMDRVSQLEKMITEPDETTEAGINKHLRNVWWLRDSLNEYFSKAIEQESC